MIRISILPRLMRPIAETLPLGTVGVEREVNEKGERVFGMKTTRSAKVLT